MNWVTNPRGFINKDNLKFSAKLIFLFFRYRLFPRAADHILTWDRAFLVEAIVTAFEIDFGRLLISVRYEKAFKASTTYTFSCMIF